MNDIVVIASVMNFLLLVYTFYRLLDKLEHVQDLIEWYGDYVYNHIQAEKLQKYFNERKDENGELQ